MKIDIISGFLGAGKTTLIKKLLEESFQGEKIALIENEFGEIGIDGGFLKDSGINITEMNSGCICCSLVGDFGENLKKVIEEYHPDRIVIEPSGVGKLSDVIKSVNELEESQEIHLNAKVTVINAKKALKQMRAFGEFFNNQIMYASTLILSRTRDITEEQLELCVKTLQELNPHASMITTPWEDLSGKQIIEAMEGAGFMAEQMLNEEHHHHDHEDGCCCGSDHDHEDGCCCGTDHDHEDGCCCGSEHDHEEGCCCGTEHDHEHHHEHDENCGCGCHDHDHDHDHEHHHHHHADEIFTSWGKETPHKFTIERIETALKALSQEEEFDDILRAKGMVESETGTWIYFDMVPGEYEIREGQPEYTGRICVIGTKIDEERILQLFGL